MSTSKWKPYPKYYTTNLSWMREIPNHWQQKRLRHLADVRLSGVDKKLNPKQKTVRFIGTDTVYNNDKIFNNFVFDNASASKAQIERLLVLKGDILLSKDSIVKTNIANVSLIANEMNDAICGYHLALIRVMHQGISPDYLFWYLNSRVINSYFRHEIKGTTIVAVDSRTISDVPILIPSVAEQKNITQFIENIDSSINKMIENLTAQLGLLEHKRSALITQAVTKGLNLNVSMKDSGIDWIGEIPEHWNTRKVKHLFQLVNEPSIASHGMELLSVYTAIGVRPRKSLEQKGNKATSTDGYWLVKKEDLVVNKLLAWMGAIGRSEYDGVTSPAYDILRPLGDTVTEYYHFLFRCGICLPEFKKRSRGIMEMRLRLYFEELGSIEVPCPPPKEQQEIADYIRNLDDTQIDLETGLNKEIEMLTEYRTVLISSAVTGKIDVRGQA